MKTEEFLGLFSDSLLNDPDRTGKPTEEDVKGGANWFMALWESEFWYEMSQRDRAEMAQHGIIGTKDMDMQEWLDQIVEQCEDEGTGEPTIETVKGKMKNWGWYVE